MSRIDESELVVPLMRIGRANYAEMEPAALARAMIEWLAVDDWCEDDGAGYCGNHDQMVRYYVTNFGSEGKVVLDPEDPQVFAVCSGAYAYSAARDEESDRLAKEAR